MRSGRPECSCRGHRSWHDPPMKALLVLLAVVVLVLVVLPALRRRR